MSLTTDFSYCEREGEHVDTLHAASDCGFPEPDCLDAPRNFGEECQGPVEYRYPLSGTGKSFPRCDKHWADRLDVQEGINRRYPTSAPSDFDPSYAGERWDDEY